MNINPITSDKGTRKQKVNFISQLFLLCGLGLVAWMKADPQLFIAYVVGVSGTSFSFMWANAAEHKADKLNNNPINPTNNP